MLNIKENQEELLTARYDKIFKTIMFNNKEILEKVLETILKRNIEIIEFVVQELPVRKEKEKKKMVDIIVKSEGEYLNIEVNTSATISTRLRNLNYFTSFFSQNTVKGIKYNVLTKFILINLTFGMDRVYKKDAYGLIEKYKLRTKSNKIYYDNFEIVEVNMDKIMKLWYSKNRKGIEENKYLIMLDLKTEEELQEISKGDAVMEKFKDNIVKINSSATFVRDITPEEDEILVRNTEIFLAKEEAKAKGRKEGLKEGMKEGRNMGRAEGLAEGRAEGLAEGLAEGRVEGRVEGRAEGINQGIEQVAKNLLKENTSLEIIAKVTGLSKEKLAEIKETIDK